MRLNNIFANSIMTYIAGSIIVIMGIALFTMFSSYWISDKSSLDASAINMAGSMRMQTLRIKLLCKDGNNIALPKAIQQFDIKIHNPIFAQARQNHTINQSFLLTIDEWVKIKQELKTSKYYNNKFYNALENQVINIDKLVRLIQEQAEANIRYLRLIQIIALFSTLGLGILILLVLKRRIQEPLVILTKEAYKIGKGDFNGVIDITGHDELSLLASALNHSSHSLKFMHDNLERLVSEKTVDLHNKNMALQFIFDITQQLFNVNVSEDVDYQQILDKLSDLLEIEKIKLCLITDAGNNAYFQATSHMNINAQQCKNDCRKCLFLINNDRGEQQIIAVTFNNISYGLLTLTYGEHHMLFFSKKSWQYQLIESVADQIAISIRHKEQEALARKNSIMKERSIIARELHDSLAQSLSYLKIQVVRLNREQERKSYENQSEIIEELRKGLSSAYQHLRELLTTFRLNTHHEGLFSALAETISEFSTQTEMELSLDNKIDSVPLSPAEEIHLLHIVREACQNSIRHSQGTRVEIVLKKLGRDTIQITIDDDGVGLPDNTDKLNHYGLAIITERARQLKAQLDIANIPPDGVRVKLVFVPDVFLERVK